MVLLDKWTNKGLIMKTYTFSGTYRRTQEFDYEFTVTSEDISRKKAWGWPPEYIASHPHLGYEEGELSVEEIEAMNEEQIREHMMEEKWWLDEIALDSMNEVPSDVYDDKADDDFEIVIHKGGE
jgi:hypothetical protein